jgi:hypothetical protein
VLTEPKPDGRAAHPYLLIRTSDGETKVHCGILIETIDLRASARDAEDRRIDIAGSFSKPHVNRV